MPQTMKAMQVKKPHGAFELVQLPVPEPAAGQVRIAVEACGLCHSDALVKEGGFPGLAYPRVPGHELVGRVDALGAGVSEWKPGQRVGVGWHGGHCFVCEPCRAGDFIQCVRAQICGISYDGGYAEYVVAPHEALAAIPDALDAVAAAPLLCAGVTTFNALRHSGARAGDTVAVQGIGGLGHLGIQFARHLGFRTVALSRGEDKRALALELGAHVYLDQAKGKAATLLQELGGARAILATAPSAKLMGPLVDGLRRDGVLLVVGADAAPIEVSPLQLIFGRRRVQGWPSGTAKDSEETLAFSALEGIAPRNEVFPLEQANEAYARMIENRVRFRAVLRIRS
ncbi:zinc-binding dehydrogenase [Aggregicoccus sp. 17bor-14]|uniref:alcohol dehydrogenase n=1 Tax=Myxococcaceae TaxID=31 RepID=UPI00129C1F5C|nr:MULTISPECIES: alcohol dehydrogenase [Myxococcaceae]MBF5043776.1 alcohol dehydrogenase catalytic domain-containing protein [Simulacricoccus sp. 17bor-14]MRI89530.1 zinc-binding dehydrogenase [Aggregicoccus sp. 17bor-14]